MAIVLALSAVLLIAFYSFLATHTLAAFEESSEITVQTDLRSTMSAIVDELEDAHLFYLDSYGAYVCYQVPLVGPSETYILDSSGKIQYGALPFDGSPWEANGYYQIVFVDHAGPLDTLLESSLTNSANPYGQNISGTFQNGITNFNASYTDAFVFGHFEVQCHRQPSSSVIGANGPNGILVGPARMIAGKCLRQYDPADTNSPKRTWPWGGGFFYMRNAQATPILNAAGTAAGTSWSPQTAESFTDTNANGVWDPGEPINDINGNGAYEEPDCDAFNDRDNNNVFNGLDTKQGNGTWNGKLRIQIRSYDAQKEINRSARQNDSFSIVRLLTTKVKVRN
jgi:hypothetical protein